MGGIKMYKLNDNVFEVGAKDPDRRIFDSLVFMPHGTTYNSYLVKGGSYNALIDCVDPEKFDVLKENLQNAGISKLDYVVLLHSEQDHSGSIHKVIEMYPQCKVVCTVKVKELMAIHLHLSDENIITKAENETLDLGGMELSFHSIPFAHWPDNTMVRLLPDNILFSSDLFGAHNSSDQALTSISDMQHKSARGYFSEIMMPFRRNIAKYTAKVEEMAPSIIAPSHGAVWLLPKEILDLYKYWTSDATTKKVTIPYVTMHDSTKIAVSCLAVQLEKRGVEVVLHDLTHKPESLLIETGEMIYDLVDCAGVVFAFCTVLGGPHPAMVYASATANAMMPKTKYMGMLCSYGWATKATETICALTQNFKSHRYEPIVFKGLPTNDVLNKIQQLADEIADAILTE